MKKLFIIACAALFAVVMAAPVYAADNLEVSGSYFARGWSVDNSGYVDGADADWFHQRFRTQFKFNVADDVHAVLRADFAEAIWGLDFDTGSVARPGNAGDNDSTKLHIDRTYINIDKDMWSLTVGQQYVGLGILEVMDANATGVNLGLKFEPATVSLIYAKIDEGGATSDDTTVTPGPTPDTNTEDTDVYAANVSFGMGDFNSNLYYAMVTDDSDAEAEPWALGFMTSGAMGAVNLTAELDFFGGDMAGGTDYTGTQFYLKGDSDITDIINVGGELIYAQGDEDDAQITGLTDWWSFTPFSNNTPVSAFYTAMVSGSSVFDPSGAGAGSMGLTIFFEANPMEKLSLGSKLGYLETEEDDVVDGDLTAFNAWVAYTIATNTDVSLTYLLSSPDADGVEFEDESTLVAEIKLAF